VSVSIAVLTISDAGARGERADASGDAIAAWIATRNFTLHARATVPDDPIAIVQQLLAWCDDDAPKLVLTTGGTGIAPRDVTREAMLVVVEREVTGIAEAIRDAGRTETPRAALTRGIAGIRGSSLVVNLPGSPAAVQSALNTLDPLVEHISALLRGDTAHP
jgi:molybdopterin adenylyltransferase